MAEMIFALHKLVLSSFLLGYVCNVSALTYPMVRSMLQRNVKFTDIEQVAAPVPTISQQCNETLLSVLKGTELLRCKCFAILLTVLRYATYFFS